MIENTLLRNIELLSDNKSFRIGAWIQNHIWLLTHLRHLTIARNTLRYQVDHGIFQRPTTKYPIRTMRKKHHNTTELLKYLSSKPYNIISMDMSFTNGWRVATNPELTFYTNSTEERNKLFGLLNMVSGLPTIDLRPLKNNILYFIDAEGNVEHIKFDAFCDLETPDEFWSESQKDEWRIRYREIERSLNKEKDDDEGLPFYQFPPDQIHPPDFDQDIGNPF